MNTSLNVTGSSHVTVSVFTEKLNTAETAFLLIVSFLGVFMNVTVCAIVLSNSKLREKVSYIFVVGLCCSQFLVASVLLPFHCFLLGTRLYDHTVSLVILAYLTNLCAVTYERYLAITASLRYHAVMPPSRAVKVVVSCWIFSIFIQFLPLMLSYSKLFERVYLYIFMAFMLLALIYLIVAYSVIYKIIRNIIKRDRERMCYFQNESLPTYPRKNSPQSLDKENCDLLQLRCMDPRSQNVEKRLSIHSQAKISLVFACVTFTYIITWFPVIYMTTMFTIRHEELVPKVLTRISVYLIGLNSLVDPTIYGLLLKDIRTNIKIKMLHKLSSRF